MSSTKKTAATPKYPRVSRKCKYCKLAFMTKPTWQGSQQKFCKPAHRKAFFDEGKQPIAVIMKRQEKRFRQIVREEICIAEKRWEEENKVQVQMTIAELESTGHPVAAQYAKEFFKPRIAN